MKNALVLISLLFLGGVALAKEVTVVSVSDFKKIEVLLNEQFENTFDGDLCTAEDIIHTLNLRLKKNGTFDIISNTQYKCAGQSGRNQGESCRVVTEENDWVLDYCD